MNSQPPKPVEWTWHDQLDSVGFEAQTISGTTGLNYSNTVTGGGTYTVANAGVGTSSYPYTTSTGITNPWSTNISPTLRLNGEGADIEINGWSLIESIRRIEQRLNILHPNEKLEAEWAELRALGDQYRKLEQHIKDKQATWDRLQAMPPPTVD